MKRFFIITIFVFFTFMVKTTAQESLKLSLRQAIELGLKNRDDLKSDFCNVELAKNNVSKFKRMLLPDASLTSEIKYTDNRQPTYLPAGFLNMEEGKKLYLEPRNNTFTGIDLNYFFLKPGQYTDIKIAKNNLVITQEKNRAKKLNIKTEISIAYYNVLLKKTQFEIAKKEEQRYKFYNELAKTRYNNGTFLQNDVLQIELNYRNSAIKTEKSRQDYLISIQNLRYKINLVTNTDIIFTDTLTENDNQDTHLINPEKYVNRRSEIIQLELDSVKNSLEMKKAKSYYLPTISLFANYSQIFKGDNLKFCNKYWSPVDYIGVKVSIPILGNIKNRNNIKECAIRASQQGYDMRQKKADINFEIQQAAYKLYNSKNNYDMAKNNYSLSEKVCMQKKIQYTVGTFSYENLLETENTVNESENNYINALYDYLIAKIEYSEKLGI